MSLTKNEIKFIKSLHLKKNRSLEQLFIVEGEKLVKELFNQNKFKVKQVLITDNYDVNQIPDNINYSFISNKDLERISAFKSPNKVLAVVHQTTSSKINFEEDNLTLVLDDVNDPGNLGTIIRTSDWFGVTQIIASKNTVELFNSKVIQSSMGAIYRVNYFVEDLEEVIQQFKKNNTPILGAVIDGENVYNTSINKKSVLLMGSESHGINETLLNLISKRLSIPKFGQTESLNVAMATGILLSEYKQNN
jgi:TrmH family RNA methyltransferase